MLKEAFVLGIKDGTDKQRRNLLVFNRGQAFTELLDQESVIRVDPERSLQGDLAEAFDVGNLWVQIQKGSR